LPPSPEVRPCPLLTTSPTPFAGLLWRWSLPIKF